MNDSSVSLYLTYISSTGDNNNIDLLYKDENIWATQKIIAEIFDVNVATINEHIKGIYKDNELDESSTIRNFLIVQNEGKRQVNREILHYNLNLIISVGFKVNSTRAVEFRKWVNWVAKDYIIKGWVMDEERFKKGHKFSTKYFEEQLEKIREIRASERMFYQKVTDIYATSSDYNKNAKVTIEFFKTVQNKLHYAVHRHTAAEIIISRADSEKDHMGLTTWKDAPDGKIQKYDVSIAKNYLNKEEMDYLNRIVTMYLDYAELQAKKMIPMTMNDWKTRLDSFIEFNGEAILIDAGKISHEEAKLYAETEFEKYKIKQDQEYISDFDRLLMESECINNEEH